MGDAQRRTPPRARFALFSHLRAHLARPDRDSGHPRSAASRGGRPVSLIGVDVSSVRGRVATKRLLPALAALLVVMLGIAALRIDLIRIRYALAETNRVEQRLSAERRSLVAEMRRLRDPAGLALRARELGFGRPAQLIDLPAPGATPRQDTSVLASSNGVGGEQQ